MSNETGVPVFVIAMGGLSSVQEFAGSSLLAQIAAETGGRQFGVQNASDLSQVAPELGRAMRAPRP